MPLDLSQIGAGQSERLIVPREIYAALPNRPWPYLRLEQGEVLERWFDQRERRDVVIKQNTGGGKTAAGLLIAQSSLNEGFGPAAYLAPDTYLVAQARNEAARLGIAVTDNPRSAQFASGQAVLIATFQRLVNGMSVFGVVGDGRDVLDIGTVIVDDAHAALAITEGQFRLTVPKTHTAYRALIGLFEDDLIKQSRSTWEDIEAGERQAVLRVPFWAWADRQDQVMDSLHPHRNDDEFKFTWPLVKDVLPICAATVTSTAVEIRPPCPPIAKIPGFAGARRRIYLTATLADDSVLVTDLDAAQEMVMRPVTPQRAADLGDRMILAPLEINPNFDELAVMTLARDIADGKLAGPGEEAKPLNVVVLVPSDRRAGAWEGFADKIWHVGDLEAGVAALKAGHLGLVVMVNKYDGIDLPGEACRLLVIDGLPRVFDAAERRERAAGSPTPALLARSIQRVEQGMGRGVRDSEDYCAVLLLGADLTQALHNPKQFALFSPATRVQIDLSKQVAVQIANEGIEAVRDAVAACLNRAPGWVRASRRALAEVRYDQHGVVRPTAVAERAAFDEAARGQYAQAAETLGIAAGKLEQSHASERGWLKEQQAVYLHFIDAGTAQQVLAAANRDNPGVLRPLQGVPVAPVRSAQAQARRAADFLGKTYESGMDLVLGVKAMLQEIDWDPERTDAAEAAWELLGFHLGLGGERPEKLYGKGPDNLWLLSGDQHAVIELKTGVTRNTPIAKKELGQLADSLNWYREHYTDTKDPVPVLVHPTSVCERSGTPPKDTRVVIPDTLARLKEAVTALAVALANGDGWWTNENSVAEQLRMRDLVGGQIYTRFAVAATQTKK